MRRAARLVAGFVGAIIIGLSLLAVSSLLTAPSVNKNIARSAEQLSQDSTWVPWYTLPMALDGFTDALKLNITYHDGSEATVRGALTGAYFSVDPTMDLDSPGSLARRTRDGAGANTNYASYWHGYLPIQRVIFTFMDLSQWRLVNTVVMCLMLTVVLVCVARRIGIDIAIGFACTLALVAPHLIPVSLQFSPVYYIALAGVLGVLVLGSRRTTRSFDLELFGALGIAVALFDLLTTPVLTLAIPLLILLVQEIRRPGQQVSDGSGRHNAVTVVRATVIWTVGYVGFWATKWVFNDIVFGFRELGGHGFHVLERAGLNMTLVGRWDSLMDNVFHLVPARLWPSPPNVVNESLVGGLLVILLLAIWGALLFAGRVSMRSVRSSWPILVVGMIPIAWILFASEHAEVHAFFAFRVLWATLFASWIWFCVTSGGEDPSDDLGD